MTALAEKPEPDARRAAGTDKRHRGQVMGFRASPGEKAAIEAAAERAGLSVGGYIRGRALAVTETRAMRRPAVERAALAQLLGQLGKCGSNVNQIARVLNSGGDEPEGVAEAIAAVKRAADAIWIALGNRPRGGRDSQG